MYNYYNYYNNIIYNFEGKKIKFQFNRQNNTKNKKSFIYTTTFKLSFIHNAPRSPFSKFVENFAWWRGKLVVGVSIVGVNEFIFNSFNPAI